MTYYEVLIADGRYVGDKPLTYSSESTLPALSLVTIPLRGRMVNGFIYKKTPKPAFAARPIKTVQPATIPLHLIELSKWISDYYACTFSDALRLLAPGGAAAKRADKLAGEDNFTPTLSLESKPNKAQVRAVTQIQSNPASTVLLHGETGSGKTRIYLELAADTIKSGRSVIILTPEIALTSQLTLAVKRFLSAKVFVLHSQLTAANRKRIWMDIAKAKDPVVVVGPRSALFSPIPQLGLIVVDEAHEPAYKQDQSPRYHAVRVASKLAQITGAKTVLGSATPNIADYFLASRHNAIVRIKRLAASKNLHRVSTQSVDLTNPASFSKVPYISSVLLHSITETLNRGQQSLLYLNRRGSARAILCSSCGWRLKCPNCDIPMVYHADEHKVRCHTCGYLQLPPSKCPNCQGVDILYKTAGTKAVADALARFLPDKRIQRFDSDNAAGERVHELYGELARGHIDIMIGTQLLAKGLDLPRLGLVGIVAADDSLNIPDFTASERAFQLTSQVMGRVGRGHGVGHIVVQTYSPGSLVINAALKRKWAEFYQTTLAERKKFGFPPYVFLLKLTCKRASAASAEKAANALKVKLASYKLPVKIVGPAPSFYTKRYGSHYWQVIVKAKQRHHLLKLASVAGGGCVVDMDPVDLL